jgi:hypothetical protein
MNKYVMLLKILDQIREEAKSTSLSSRYIVPVGDLDQINQARARAFIHLYLKVSFGLLDFAERERFITDGSYDGGVDGYYVDKEARVIYFIQSKFRTTEANFRSKLMTVEELLAMDVARILDGHEEDENGNKYNGKILGLQREIRSIEDIARYKYKVVLLANVDVPSPSKLARVVGGFSCEVLDYEKCYELLVFPVVSGTYFNASDLVIHLDLSNKSAGSKISYTVDTRFGECDITVLFVPTLEIAKTFNKFKNSILRFNPRSYLELEGAKVNEAIRTTILQQGKNEFALYNNGITMLSDETNLNERIGQRNKAQLNIRNPQIINGGQTAYTLSRIYVEHLSGSGDALFAGKEVLLKVITLNSGAETKESEKLRLIEAISEATNLQTAVITADRYSNEEVNLQLQKTLFDKYGLLYERKRGEFQDGLHNGYVRQSQIVERNLFFRILFAANGDLNRAIQKRLFAKLSRSGWGVPTQKQLDRFYFAFLCFQLLDPRQTKVDYQTREIYGKLYAMVSRYLPDEVGQFQKVAEQFLPTFVTEWADFVRKQEKNNDRFIKIKLDRTGTPLSYFARGKWARSGTFANDIENHFGTHRISPSVS